MKDPDSVCNEAVFNQVYNDISQSVWRFAYYKCGDEAQADDLVQDAFIKLWSNCAKVAVAKAKSFLFTVTNNAFLNQIAHKKVVLKHAQLTPSKVDNESPEFVLEEKQYHKKLQDAISNLSEAQRTAFLLNRIDGMKYAEIAEHLNISVKAVEKRMSQALKQLRSEFKNI
ncbi:RNA polymerase subunit sigma-70 [Pukyongia salina]|uniref:RNA polymerase subunit sigma-70 n=1 Tax=Pukyongia salina TaxID=2094025 RepID=A0A2S0HU01_9FLAO|nr:RNA polymerase sigma factor [Pukyongia salina]AVI50024.1 RNA polymerase subunit sigma-70 [Pukyongia salina]